MGKSPGHKDQFTLMVIFLGGVLPLFRQSGFIMNFCTLSIVKVSSVSKSSKNTKARSTDTKWRDCLTPLRHVTIHSPMVENANTKVEIATGSSVVLSQKNT